MVWRNSRGTPVNAPAAFINPCHTKDGSAIIDTEVVWLGSDGVADFDALHSRVSDERATACAFDLLMLNGEDIRKKPFAERKAMLRKVLRRSRGGIQYVEHTEGDGGKIVQGDLPPWT